MHIKTLTNKKLTFDGTGSYLQICHVGETVQLALFTGNDKPIRVLQLVAEPVAEPVAEEPVVE